MRKCKVASEEILFEKNTNQWKSVCCTASSFLSSLPLPCRRSVLKQWARQCRRHHHPHRRHHHPYHRHKDLHQIESTSSGIPGWSNALRTPLPSCWRQPRCCDPLRFSSFPSSFRCSRSQAIAIQSSSGSSEPGEPGEQGGRRRLPAVDQGAASQFIIF